MFNQLFQAMLLVSTLTSPQSFDKKLDPDFEVGNEAVARVFREELAIALAKTPGASPETRTKIKRAAEKLAANLFRKGQKLYNLPRKTLNIVWDSTKPAEIALAIGDENHFTIHLNEIMFFTHHDDHLSSVLPHEVGHFIHFLHYGRPDVHDVGLWMIVGRLNPDFVQKELDITAACRLSARMLAANGNTGTDEECPPSPPIRK